MRIGDVIYDNDTVLIASASFNKEEPCKECFFYDGHECQSNRYIECWDKSINKDLIMIPFENNKVQDSKMMDHSSKTVTSKTGKDLLSALSRLSSITGDETNDMADTASRTLFSSLSMLDINKKFLSLGIRLGVKGAAISIHRSLSSNDDVSIKDVIKEIINSIESDELLQQKRRAYYLSDEGFEEYKKFLSDPDQKKFCFKGYYYVEVKEQDDKELSGLMGRVVYE